MFTRLVSIDNIQTKIFLTQNCTIELVISSSNLTISGAMARQLSRATKMSFFDPRNLASLEYQDTVLNPYTHWSYTTLWRMTYGFWL